MDPHAELVQLLLDGARYGDEEDIDSALRQHVGIDSTDEAGRTGVLNMICCHPVPASGLKHFVCLCSTSHGLCKWP
jgi:hypothetical protein